MHVLGPAWVRRSVVPVAVGVVTLVVDWVLFAPLGFGDDQSYLNVARTPGRFADVVPFSYRVGVPYLANLVHRVTPLGLTGSFRMLAATGFVAVVALLVAWTRDGLNFSTPTAVAIGALYATSYAGVYNMHHAVQVGVFEHLFLLLGFMAIWHRRLGALLVVVFVGAWCKESMFLLVAAEFIVALASREGWRAAVERSTAATAAAATPFLLLHTGLVLRGAPPLATYWHTQRSLGGYWNTAWASVSDFVKRSLVALGAWLPLSILGWRGSARVSRALCLVVPLFLAQSITATTFERVFVSAFPALVVLCASAMERAPRLAVALIAYGAGSMFAISRFDSGRTFAVVAFAQILVCIAVTRGAQGQREVARDRSPRLAY